MSEDFCPCHVGSRHRLLYGPTRAPDGSDVGVHCFPSLWASAPRNVVRKELRGDFRSTPFTFFWNAWLEKK
jgi:hypothetical protein